MPAVDPNIGETWLFYPFLRNLRHGRRGRRRRLSASELWRAGQRQHQTHQVRLPRQTVLGEHGGDLALGRTVDARIGPAPLPAVQIRLGIVEPLEAEAAQRRLLRVADGCFDLALAVGVADAARQGHGPVVGQHVAVERIERGVVDVRSEDALLEVVEYDDADTAAQPPERPLVQLGPDLRARTVDQQPDGLAP